MLNAIGLQGPGVEGLIRDYAPQWAQWDFPVFVNINGESAAEYGDLAARLDGVAGVAGFEINISCPNPPSARWPCTSRIRRPAR
jgi:dihydroorotate dehydrogenase (NAD+) catalytic subunit